MDLPNTAESFVFVKADVDVYEGEGDGEDAEMSRSPSASRSPPACAPYAGTPAPVSLLAVKASGAGGKRGVGRLVDSTQADDRRMIHLVRDRPLLYARSNLPVASYQAQVKKLWREVADIMGWTVTREVNVIISSGGKITERSGGGRGRTAVRMWTGTEVHVTCLGAARHVTHSRTFAVTALGLRGKGPTRATKEGPHAAASRQPPAPGWLPGYVDHVKDLVADVRRKWSHIRNSYSRHLRNEIHGVRTGKGRQVSKWYLADELEFLREHMATDTRASPMTPYSLTPYSNPFLKLEMDAAPEPEPPTLAPLPAAAPALAPAPWYALPDAGASEDSEPDESEAYFQFFRGIYKDYRALAARQQRTFRRQCLIYLHELVDEAEGAPAPAPARPVNLSSRDTDPDSCPD